MSTLTDSINASLPQGVLPSSLRNIHITPLPKKYQSAHGKCTFRPTEASLTEPQVCELFSLAHLQPFRSNLMTNTNSRLTSETEFSNHNVSRLFYNCTTWRLTALVILNQNRLRQLLVGLLCKGWCRVSFNKLRVTEFMGSMDVAAMYLT